MNPWGRDLPCRLLRPALLTGDAAQWASGDFTTTLDILGRVSQAIVSGVLGAGVSLALLDMSGFFTTLLYLQRLRVHLMPPYGNTLGSNSALTPIGGGQVAGLMARFGAKLRPALWNRRRPP
jgi:hypothetical protein